MSEVVTECTCGQLAAQDRRMYALTSTQGTAIAASAVCGACAMSEAGERVMADAATAADYDGTGARDCTGNDALACQVCGWDGPPATCPDIGLADDEREVCHCGGKVRFGKCRDCGCQTPACDACGAEAGEECRPTCIGQAAEQDALGELVQDVRAAIDGDGDLIRAAQALADAVWPESDSGATEGQLARKLAANMNETEGIPGLDY